MTPLRLEVKLWVKDAQFDRFKAFEDAASRIMGFHGGKVLEIIETHHARDGSPHETHLLGFPDQASFDAYRSDPDLLALAELRATCIADTKLTVLD